MSAYPIVVIGAGAGGLVIAIGAAKAGKKVLLIDKGNWGGDCTNFGCIPSKSLIAAAEAAHMAKTLSEYGIQVETTKFNCQGALERTRQIIEQIRSHEDPAALAKLGVDTLTGTASFKDPFTLTVSTSEEGDQTVKGKKIIIATGSYPFIPEIPGLKECPHCTNETIFTLKDIPQRLGIIGGGPIGCELAQAFQRLGSKVTIIQHHAHLLIREQTKAQQVIEDTFQEEGISLMMNFEPIKISHHNKTISIHVRHRTNNTEEILLVDQLLVSAGRRPSIKALNLDSIGIKTHAKGISTDPFGRTSQKHIWAVGDVTGYAMFTHVAENQARTVLRNVLLFRPFYSKLDQAQAVPRVTYTDPEIASIGLSEEEAKVHFGEKKIASYTISLTEVDRAITSGRTEGFVKIVTKKWSSRILGATLVAPPCWRNDLPS